MAIRRTSEDQLQGELDLARGGACRRNQACVPRDEVGNGAGRRSARSREDAADGLSQICVVDDVEEFCPELGVQLLRNPGLLDYGEVEIQEAWTDQGIPTNVAECSERLNSITGWVEPLHRPLQGIDGIGYLARVATGRARVIRTIRRYPAGVRHLRKQSVGDVDGITRGGTQNLAELPARNQPVAAERQVIDGVDPQCVRDIEEARTTIKGLIVRVENFGGGLFETRTGRTVVNTPRVGVGHLALQVPADLARKARHQAIVGGMTGGGRVVQTAESGVWEGTFKEARGAGAGIGDRIP